MNWLIEKLKEHDSKKAIIFNERVYTYNDLYNQVLEYNKLVSAKINTGQVVAILSDYSFHSIALFLSLLENKNIIVPITTKVEHEIKERLEEANVDMSISLEDGHAMVHELSADPTGHSLVKGLQDSKKSGLVLFSSGSTGKPKAMIHNLDSLLDTFMNKKSRDMNFLVFLMFDHIGGLNTLFNTLSMGVTITLPTSRDANYVCSLIEKYKVDILPASPTFLNLVLMAGAHEKYDLSSLKMITYGTEPMPESLLNRLKEAFPRVRFLQTFGTSETGIAVTKSKSSTSTFIKINDPNLEYKIVDNELWLRSKTQILGYLNASMESFTDDGWFKTGDLVEEAEDGYICIKGRNKEMINVGGEKVLPAEVESILLLVPEIKDCMVYPEKNAITGQAVAADIVLHDINQKKEIKKIIRRFCKGKLDHYKIPVKINVVEKTNFGDRFKKIRNKGGN